MRGARVRQLKVLHVLPVHYRPLYTVKGSNGIFLYIVACTLISFSWAKEGYTCNTCASS